MLILITMEVFGRVPVIYVKSEVYDELTRLGADVKKLANTLLEEELKKRKGGE